MDNKNIFALGTPSNGELVVVPANLQAHLPYTMYITNEGINYYRSEAPNDPTKELWLTMFSSLQGQDLAGLALSNDELKKVYEELCLAKSLGSDESVEAGLASKRETKSVDVVEQIEQIATEPCCSSSAISDSGQAQIEADGALPVVNDDEFGYAGLSEEPEAAEGKEQDSALVDNGETEPSQVEFPAMPDVESAAIVTGVVSDQDSGEEVEEESIDAGVSEEVEEETTAEVVNQRGFGFNSLWSETTQHAAGEEQQPSDITADVETGTEEQSVPDVEEVVPADETVEGVTEEQANQMMSTEAMERCLEEEVIGARRRGLTVEEKEHYRNISETVMTDLTRLVSCQPGSQGLADYIEDISDGDISGAIDTLVEATTIRAYLDNGEEYASAWRSVEYDGGTSLLRWLEDNLDTLLYRENYQHVKAVLAPFLFLLYDVTIEED